MFFRSKSRWICVFFVFTLLTNYCDADGKLSRARSQTRKSSPVPKQPKQPKPSSSRSNDSKDDDSPGILSGVVSAVISTSSDSNPKPPKEHRPKRRRRNRARVSAPIISYHNGCVREPYFPPTIGVVPGPVIAPAPVMVVPQVYDPVVVETPAPIVQPAPTAVVEPSSVVDSTPVFIGGSWFEDWGVHFGAKGGTDFGDLSNFGFDLLLQAPGAVGLDIDVTTFRESNMSFRDHLWIGDANLVVETISGPELRARLGIGVNWLADSIGSEAGFNLTGSFDLKLSDRWLLVGEGDVGTLGDADFLHTEISLERRVGNAGLSVGYQFYDIGGVEIEGLITGLEFRF